MVRMHQFYFRNVIGAISRTVRNACNWNGSRGISRCTWKQFCCKGWKRSSLFRRQDTLIIVRFVANRTHLKQRKSRTTLRNGTKTTANSFPTVYHGNFSATFLTKAPVSRYKKDRSELCNCFKLPNGYSERYDCKNWILFRGAVKPATPFRTRT